ncbi:MAG: PASTA domain-containing protein [Tannerellaceae bacterium]|jgi:beta-lactam-binding protein with PASTA domain|nr:PASTA domain-containing protein [Tannerellaceae bacterium]
MKDFWVKLIKNPFVLNLLLAGIVSCVIVYGTLKWLESYTRHSAAIIVPDIKGLKLEEAVAFLQNSGLRYNVIDSVFSKTAIPGSVVELVPAAGSKVKEGRILFLTVNALTSQMAEIPEIEDTSLRQAYTLLRARGFESIEIEYVPGDYKDLVLAVESRGRQLEKGEAVKLTAPLILKVSSGELDLFSGDVPDMEQTPLESATPGHEPVKSLDSEKEKWF